MNMDKFKTVIERLRQMQSGAVDLPNGEYRQLSKETLRELDSFFLSEILETDELSEPQRGELLELYLNPVSPHPKSGVA